MKPILGTADLEEQLSAPTQGVLETLRALPGDVLVLGAGGKMGPTLARMVRRALDEIEQGSDRSLPFRVFRQRRSRKNSSDMACGRSCAISWIARQFWRRFAEIENVVAIKMAPFNRYQTLDVVRAVIAAGREDIALYTGNDDNIVADLLTRIDTGGASLRGCVRSFS